MIRVLAAFVVGVALGVGGTLIVDSSKPLDQRAIDRAYYACLRTLAAPSAGNLFPDPLTASDRAVCRREARDAGR